MYCVYCGAQVDETARFCPQCGKPFFSSASQSPLGGAESPLNASCENPYAYGGSYERSPRDPESEPINDFLLWNILATLFCFMPVGIVGIIFSCLCNSARRQGDFQTAYRRGRTAKILFWISFAAGVALILAYMFFISFGIVITALNESV